MSEISSGVAVVVWKGQLEFYPNVRELANQLTSWHEKDYENAIVRMTISN